MGIVHNLRYDKKLNLNACIGTRKDLPLKSCGGLSDVHVHADRHMHMYGTAKETEQMLNKGFQHTAPKIIFLFCREDGKAFYEKARR